VKLDVALGTALIGLYNKCGLLEEGLRIFTFMKEKNLHSWTIMVSRFTDIMTEEKTPLLSSTSWKKEV